jgi:hypothetical protein
VSGLAQHGPWANSDCTDRTARRLPLRNLTEIFAPMAVAAFLYVLLVQVFCHQKGWAGKFASLLT